LYLHSIVDCDHSQTTCMLDYDHSQTTCILDCDHSQTSSFLLLHQQHKEHAVAREQDRQMQKSGEGTQEREQEEGEKGRPERAAQVAVRHSGRKRHAAAHVSRRPTSCQGPSSVTGHSTTLTSPHTVQARAANRESIPNHFNRLIYMAPDGGALRAPSLWREAWLNEQHQRKGRQGVLWEWGSRPQQKAASAWHGGVACRVKCSCTRVRTPRSLELQQSQRTHRRGRVPDPCAMRGPAKALMKKGDSGAMGRYLVRAA